MDATDQAEAPEVTPEAQVRDTNAEYADLMRKQQAMAVEMELQGIAMRSQPVAELIAERDALRAKVADLEAGAAKRKPKA